MCFVSSLFHQSFGFFYYTLDRRFSQNQVLVYMRVAEFIFRKNLEHIFCLNSFKQSLGPGTPFRPIFQDAPCLFPIGLSPGSL